MLTTVIFVVTVLAGSAIAPAFVHENGQTMQNDNKMSDSKMKDDKMKDDKMSRNKHRKHRRRAKHKTDDNMQTNKNQ